MTSCHSVLKTIKRQCAGNAFVETAEASLERSYSASLSFSRALLFQALPEISLKS